VKTLVTAAGTLPPWLMSYFVLLRDCICSSITSKNKYSSLWNKTLTYTLSILKSYMFSVKRTDGCFEHFVAKINYLAAKCIKLSGAQHQVC